MRISDWSSDVCSSDLERAATLPRISVRRVGRAKSARFTGAGEGALGTASLIFIRVEPRRWSLKDAVDAEECLHNGTKRNMSVSALAALLLLSGSSDTLAGASPVHFALSEPRGEADPTPPAVCR